MIGIYKITSSNNRIYIGQSIDIERRFRFYKRLNCKKQPILYRSFLKYGVENHTFEIIEECLFEELSIRERYWQEFYNVLEDGLNCNLTETDTLPRKLSNETKLKISKANLGKTMSENARLKMSLAKKEIKGSGNDFYGKHHTKEFKENRSKNRSGEGNPKAKLVLNLETGIFYGCVGDAANTINVKPNILTHWLNGTYKNKTSFIYV